MVKHQSLRQESQISTAAKSIASLSVSDEEDAVSLAVSSPTPTSPKPAAATPVSPVATTPVAEDVPGEPEPAAESEKEEDDLEALLDEEETNEAILAAIEAEEDEGEDW